MVARPPVKLNLACGTDIREPPWVNLDVVRKWPLAARPCDFVWDARSDRIPFVSESADEVYAGYLLLHLAPIHHARVLADVLRVMRPGARAVFGEIDMSVLLPRWLANPADPYLSGLVWGEQGELPGMTSGDQRLLADFDKHCQGFTESSLVDCLRRAGFRGMRRGKVHGPMVWYELSIECFK